MPPPDLARRLRRIVGDPHVIADPERLFVYESDGLTAYRRRPLAVVLPGTTRELADVVAAVHDGGIPVVPRGAGTGLSGGALADEDSIVVGTARMDRILELDPANRVARVQPGVVNAHLGRAASLHGLYYAPDPSSQSACTLGGNVAENSGGPHCLKYGVTSRYVTGLTVVLGGGRVVELGGGAAGPPTADGLDLVGLFVGSEGCFGMAAEIEVRLLPVPEAVRTLLAIFDSVEAAARAVTDIVAEGLLPAAMEIMDGASIQAVEASVYAAGYPTDAGAALVVEFDGAEAGLDADVEAAERCCRGAGAREVRRARDEAERARLWQGRKKAFGAMGRIAPDLLVQDATVPRTRLPEVLGRIMEIGGRYGLHVGNVFHAGDGNLHPKILFDRRDAEEVERVEKASKEMMAVCVASGGTITGEHGVGVDKRRYMPLVHGPAELAAMADVKEVFDPRGLFNPGKVLPTEEEIATAGREFAALREEMAERGRDAGDADRESPPADGPARPDDAIPGELRPVVEALREATRAGRRLRPGEGPLDLRGLTGMEVYEPADLTFTARAGTPIGDLQDELVRHGQWLPFDPPCFEERTLGAFVAAAPAGPLAASYGSVRDHVLGVTLVTGDGRVLRLGGRVVKNVAGFDLVRAVVGSRGALGVITSATLRVFPRPVRDALFEATGEPDEVAGWAARIASAPLVPASAVATATRRGEPGRLRVRLHGSAASVDADRDRLAAHLRVSLQAVPGDRVAHALREDRDRFAGRGSRGTIVVRPSAFAEAFRLALAGGRGPVAGDPLAGRIHVDRDGGPPPRRAAPGQDAGSIARSGEPSTGAPGIGAPGTRGPERGDPAARELAAALRRRFDPAGVLAGAEADA